jgi:WD40 repeat protein
MEWLLEGPLPIDGLCNLVGDYVPNFTGKEPAFKWLFAGPFEAKERAFKWLFAGPLPIEDICKLIAAHVPAFTWKVSAVEPGEVELLSAVSDTLVVYKMEFENCIYAWDVATDIRSDLIRVSPFYEITALLATPQGDVLIAIKPRSVGAKNLVLRIRPNAWNLNNIYLEPPQFKLYSSLELFAVIKREIQFDALCFSNHLVLSDGTLVAIAENYEKRHMLFLDATERHVELEHNVTCLAALPDTQLASGGEDGSVRIWNLQGVCVHQLLACGSPVRALAWNVDMLAVCTDSRVEKYYGGAMVSAVPHMSRLQDTPGESFFTMLEDYTIVMSASAPARHGDLVLTCMTHIIDFGHCRVVGAVPGGLRVVD